MPLKHIHKAFQVNTYLQYEHPLSNAENFSINLQFINLLWSQIIYVFWKFIYLTKYPKFKNWFNLRNPNMSFEHIWRNIWKLVLFDYLKTLNVVWKCLMKGLGINFIKIFVVIWYVVTNHSQQGLICWPLLPLYILCTPFRGVWCHIWESMCLLTRSLFMSCKAMLGTFKFKIDVTYEFKFILNYIS